MNLQSAGFSFIITTGTDNMRKKSELKRNLRKGLGERLGQLRHSLEISRNKMANVIDIHRVTFQRNEVFLACPRFLPKSKNPLARYLFP